MYRTSLLVSIIVIFLTQQGCNTRQQTGTQPADSTAAIQTRPTTADVPITDRLIELNLTPDSDWRGISLGDDFASVNAKEKAKRFERDDRHVGYTVELKNLETADVLYYQANQKVSAIDVDLYVNSRRSVNDFQKELGAYFTARYGSSKPAAGGLLWNGPKGEQVTLKDVSKGKDFGLKVRIAPAAGTTIASSR